MAFQFLKSTASKRKRTPPFNYAKLFLFFFGINVIKSSKELKWLSQTLSLYFHCINTFVMLVVCCCISRFKSVFSSLALVTCIITFSAWYAIHARQKECIKLQTDLKSLSRKIRINGDDRKTIRCFMRWSVFNILLICLVPATASAVLIYNTDHRSTRCNECWFSINSRLGRSIYSFLLQFSRQMVNWGLTYGIGIFFSCCCLELDAIAKKLLDEVTSRNKDSISPPDLSTSRDNTKFNSFRMMVAEELGQDCFNVEPMHGRNHDSSTNRLKNDLQTASSNDNQNLLKPFQHFYHSLNEMFGKRFSRNSRPQPIHSGANPYRKCFRTKSNLHPLQSESCFQTRRNSFENESYFLKEQMLTQNKFIYNHKARRSLYRLVVKAVYKLENTMSLPILLVVCNGFNELYRSLTHSIFHFKIEAPPHLIVLAVFYMVGATTTFLSVVLCADRLLKTCTLLRKAIMDDDPELTCVLQELPEMLQDDLELLEDKDNISLTAWGMFDVNKGFLVHILASLISFSVVLGQIKI
ncbi:hypothetical protein JTE90_018695 [Oedothorax gibbosus]|uniref:Gustatory receptor n=1 Tax=Oedothorax gibbosus TaxID=931172 RepID=A0AAV6V050_9ARAC|nr:hypothetical protein JTE90_018695 [Oedothorax gibbosus]